MEVFFNIINPIVLALMAILSILQLLSEIAPNKMDALLKKLFGAKRAANAQAGTAQDVRLAELMALPLAARLASLHFASYQEMYDNGAEYFTDEEVEELVEAGELDTSAKFTGEYTQDDIVQIGGQYYENERSEDWEDFEYQYEEDHHDRF